MLRIAVQAKGRLFEETMALLEESDIKLSTTKRTLLVQSSNFPIEVLFLRDDDIPQTVATGVADLGVVGENEFMEKEEDAEKIYGNKKAIINLDVISRSFEANDVVTVNTLKEKHLIAKNVYFVKVLARGVIDKPLVIKAQDFSIDAAKMIQLTGGKVVMLTKRKYF